MRGGQISFEYIAIFGLVLLLTVPLFYIGLSRSKENIRHEQVTDTVDSIVKNADEVYSLGLGSKDFVWVNTPTGITSAYVDGKTFVITLSIFGANSEYIAISKANLTVTQDFLDKIILAGRYKVKVETYLNSSSGNAMVLLGGYCGDGICSSSENSDTCLSDCEDYCGDGICNYPGTPPNEEGCLADYCSDCIGSQADCDDGDVCEETPGTGLGTCVAGAPVCGDGECQGEPYIENCQNCKLDCQEPLGWYCCYDAGIDSWYSASQCGIPPTVTSCPDWCVYTGNRDGSGYNTGVCALNINKCGGWTGGAHVEIDEMDVDETGGGDGCGDEPFPPGDGECDGDEYCWAGEPANTCCCIILG